MDLQMQPVPVRRVFRTLWLKITILCLRLNNCVNMTPILIIFLQHICKICHHTITKFFSSPKKYRCSTFIRVRRPSNGPQRRYVFDLFVHLCVRRPLTYGRARRGIYRPACRRLLVYESCKLSFALHGDHIQFMHLSCTVFDNVGITQNLNSSRNRIHASPRTCPQSAHH